MQKQLILEQINNIFQDVFDDENIVVTESTTSSDIDDWDSLTHITLISAIERQFKIKFTIEEAIGFKNIAEMLSVINARINES